MKNVHVCRALKAMSLDLMIKGKAHDQRQGQSYFCDKHSMQV